MVTATTIPFITGLALPASTTTKSGGHFNDCRIGNPQRDKKQLETRLAGTLRVLCTGLESYFHAYSAGTASVRALHHCFFYFRPPFPWYL